MTIQVLPNPFTVSKVGADVELKLTTPFCFASVTEDERSLVCPTAHVPAHTLAREDGWRAFRVAGSMDFGLIGILAQLTGVLAANSIPVFAISTFDTDYLLVKADLLDVALAALETENIKVQPY